jgi:hypothetical protein
MSKNSEAGPRFRAQISSIEFSLTMPIDDVGLQPDEPLALVVDRRLVGDRPERERGGERVEGGAADREADHTLPVDWREDVLKPGATGPLIVCPEPT